MNGWIAGGMAHIRHIEKLGQGVLDSGTEFYNCVRLSWWGRSLIHNRALWGGGGGAFKILNFAKNPRDLSIDL